jgi:hypothetical protein
MVANGPRSRRWCASLAAVALLAFTAAQAPHLVHHLFDHAESGGEECPFAAAPDRLPLLLADAAPVPLELTAGVRVDAEAARAASCAGLPGSARAPPRSTG